MPSGIKFKNIYDFISNLVNDFLLETRVSEFLSVRQKIDF